jgi:hypothetical protein
MGVSATAGSHHIHLRLRSRLLVISIKFTIIKKRDLKHTYFTIIGLGPLPWVLNMELLPPEARVRPTHLIAFPI